MNPAPIPRDIPLPLPASAPLLEVLLIVAFVAHILFVNLMVGGSLLVLGFQLRGLRDSDYDRLARALASSVTVNKSLAVVLGVAPLLLINVLYTIHFYTANALTGTAWILVVPSVAAAFLLLYLHKYTWDKLADQRRLHIAINALAVALFLFIPLIFLANVNLMMFPERWTSVHGFVEALLLPNVVPRYFHFLSASLILASLFGVGYCGRRRFVVDGVFASLDRPRIRRAFYSIAFVVSLAQFLIGPLVLFTLPTKGLHTSVVSSILFGALLAIPAVWMMWSELATGAPDGKRLPYIVAALGVTVLFMATGRHTYRGIALADHKRAMRVATEQWIDDAEQARYDLESGRARAAGGVSDGQHIFQSTCGGCHAVDKKLVGPPLTEIAQIYAGNPDGIVAWARAPGKKRPETPQMPPMAGLGDAKLRLIASFMLEAGTMGKSR
jgi:cytochrome c